MRLVITAVLFVVGSTTGIGRHATDATEDHITARASLKNASGSTVGGAFLRETPNGVLLRADLRGVPAGTHAFHIHEIGKCEGPTFESAGGHFAPEGRAHGFFEKDGPHAGDLPNLHVPAEGQLSVELFVRGITVKAGPRSVIDADRSALIVHAGEDDYRTEPAGSAGDRILCGVIMR